MSDDYLSRVRSQNGRRATETMRTGSNMPEIAWPPVKTLADMTPEERAEISRIYGAPISKNAILTKKAAEESRKLDRRSSAFLGEDAIMDIWKRREAGENAADVAKLYGVTDVFVRKLSASPKGLRSAVSAMARRRAIFEANRALDAIEAEGMIE